MLKQGNLFDDRYELTRFIGRGGFAEVWLVNDRLTGLEEALKIYAPGSGMDEDGLKLFAKELSVVHDLRHSNLLTPKMLGQYENQPYLILPYCPYGSLNKNVGKCTEDNAWKIIGQVAAGLAYLHKCSIVHQDIKPDNILLDANNDCVITDFGISLKAQSTLRKSMHTQNISGTVAYMAPERFSSEPLPIPANDIWSLGAMMFELVEGNTPFLPQMGGLAQMNGAQIPTMHANVSENLKQTIIAMLNETPKRRPTAEQLVEIARSKGVSQEILAQKEANNENKTQPSKDINHTLIIERNTYIGQNQKNSMISNNNAAVNNSNKELKRHGFVSFWLWAIIASCVFIALMGCYIIMLNILESSNFPDMVSGVFSASALLFLVAHAWGAIMLLKWKKSGFFIIAGDLIFGFFMLYIMHYFAFFIFAFYLTAALMDIAALFGVLQIKKDGVSCWSLLKSS